MVFLSIPKEAPRADPHAGCCGSRGRKAPGDPIRVIGINRVWSPFHNCLPRRYSVSGERSISSFQVTVP